MSERLTKALLYACRWHAAKRKREFAGYTAYVRTDEPFYYPEDYKKNGELKKTARPKYINICTCFKMDDAERIALEHNLITQSGTIKTLTDVAVLAMQKELFVTTVHPGGEKE